MVLVVLMLVTSAMRQRCRRDVLGGLAVQLLVHESGRMRLVIGEHSFLVNTTVPCLHVQQAVAVDATTQSMVVLGNVPHRLVVETDIDAVLGRQAAC